MNEAGQPLSRWEDGDLSPGELEALRRELSRPEGRRALVEAFHFNLNLDRIVTGSSPARLADIDAPRVEPGRRVRKCRPPAREARILPFPGARVCSRRPLRRTRGLDRSARRRVFRGPSRVMAAAVSIIALALLVVALWPRGSRLPTVVGWRGEVVVESRGVRRAPETGEPVAAGTHLRTGAAAGAAIQYPDEATRLLLGERSRLVFLAGGASRHLSLDEGDLTVDLDRETSALILDTPRARITVSGARFRVQAQPVGSVVAVEAGRVMVIDRASATPFEVLANQLFVTEGGGEPPSLNVPWSAVSPVIDGQVDPIWWQAPRQAVTKLTVGARPVAADSSASWSVLWNEESLFFLVEVADDVIVNDSPRSWDDDTVEIYLDPDNSRGASFDGVNDYHVMFGPGDVAVFPCIYSLKDTRGMRFATTRTESGYRVEAAIPWSRLGVNARAGRFLGIDIAVNDDDNGARRESQLSWHDATGEAFRIPERMGRARLAPRPGATFRGPR